MTVSIAHRVTGDGLAIVGGILFVWWLVALAGGEASYAHFVAWMTSESTGRLSFIPGVVLIGLTWSFLQHMCSGIRHLLLDTGAGYELKVNRIGALATFVVSTILTLAIWAGIFWRS